eukprot:TRINITY_DN6678_c0_g1_i4.p1 TRINITY_DN6678_c0_g1~~TRINITY_DN6678_c0_g1_i4.p1  ORF type:complete len:464 (-),score=32.38 TRINITY_DN6678_c0_g1_i4:145-1536(-)
MCLGQIVIDLDRRIKCRGYCDHYCAYCGSLFRFDKRQSARFTHFNFFCQIVFLTLLLTRLWPQIFNSFGSYIGCPEGSEKNEYLCISLSVVYRVSLALVAVFAIVLYVTLSRDGGSMVCNEGCWFWKVLVFICTFFGMLFVNNENLGWFIDTSRILSIFFIFLQVCLLIDFFYTWGESWVRKYDEGAVEYKYYLLLFTVLLFVVVIYLFIRGLIWFSGDGCFWNVGVLVLNMILCTLLTGLSISNLVTKSSLLTSSAISAMIMTLTISALSSDNRTECNSLLGEDHNTLMIIEISVSIGLLMLVLGYLSLANDSNSTSTVGVVKELELKELPPGAEVEEAQFTDEYGQLRKVRTLRNVSDPNVWPDGEAGTLAAYKGKSFVMFQLLMLLAAFYFGVLLTNWGSIEMGTAGTDSYMPNDSAYWIKLSASWLTCLVYLWTMIAPRILPERFGSQRDSHHQLHEQA